MSHAQTERVGATIRDDLVEHVDRADDGRFRVEPREGRIVTADRVVAASVYDVSYLDGLLGEHFLSEGGETWLDPDLAGERGETPVDGLRLAGATAGVESQIAVAVGHGARVGVGLVESYRRTEEDIREGSASYTDWVVQQGRYAGEDWLETATGWHLDAAPDDIDEETAEERARGLATEQQARQIGEAEVERRTERAHRRLLAHVDDDRIIARAQELRADRNATEADR